MKGRQAGTGMKERQAGTGMKGRKAGTKEEREEKRCRAEMCEMGRKGREA